MTNLAAFLRLMAVTDDSVVGDRDLVALCRAAERGGATSLQLRFKTMAPGRLAAAVRSVVVAVGIPVLVNDRVDVALAAGAAGVHLGADDLPPGRVREIVPSGFIIGASVGDPAEAERGRGADYWGIGPWGATGTKPDAGAPLGRDGFARLTALASGHLCVAVGSVRPQDVAEVIKAGGVGVAVVTGVFGASDPALGAAAYRAAISGASP